MKIKADQYSVYHGGSLYGMGRWSGPHTTLMEAMASARACEQTVGSRAIIRAELADGTKLRTVK